MSLTTKRTYNLKPSPTDPRDLVHPVCAAKPRALLPRHVDLRPEMPPVLDQGGLGSCASNAASNCLRYLLRKQGKPEFQPSRLYIYWNTRVNIAKAPAAEDTGVCIRDVCKALTKYHACDETVWPYIESKFSVAPSLEAYKNADTHGQLSYASVPQNLDQIKQVLSSGFPIILGINIYASFETMVVAKTGIVPVPKADEPCYGGHAIILVGYNDSKSVFMAMNSWGVGWGQTGFFEIPYRYVTDRKLAYDFWALSYFA